MKYIIEGIKAMLLVITIIIVLGGLPSIQAFLSMTFLVLIMGMVLMFAALFKYCKGVDAELH